MDKQQPKMTREEAIRKIASEVKGIRIAMVTTVGEDGEMHSRPMATHQMEFDGDLWFFTAANSGKAIELAGDPHVNVAFCDPETNRFVSVAGHGRVVVDKQKAAQLWGPQLKTWFPEGLEDPDLALIQVTPVSAQYWDAPTSRIVQVLGMVKAVATGKRYQPGENRRINLH
jgi:general stress protein 26